MTVAELDRLVRPTAYVIYRDRRVLSVHVAATHEALAVARSTDEEEAVDRVTLLLAKRLTEGQRQQAWADGIYDTAEAAIRSNR